MRVTKDVVLFPSFPFITPMKITFNSEWNQAHYSQNCKDGVYSSFEMYTTSLISFQFVHSELVLTFPTMDSLNLS